MATSPSVTPPVPSMAPPAANPAAPVGNTAALVRIRYSPGSADAQPCNWDLKPAGQDADGVDLIEGTNNVTGSTFSGTHAEFSEAIRGE